MSTKIGANEIKVGMILEHENGLWNVMKREHVKLSKGPACVQTTIKNIETGTKKDHRFGSSDKVMKATITEEKLSFMYEDGSEIHLMDESFEQISISSSLLGDQIHFIREGIEITVVKHNDSILMARVPDEMSFEIDETEPYIKGQTATSSFKPAWIIGDKVRIMVPPFVVSGDKVVINTSSNEYMRRSTDEK